MKTIELTKGFSTLVDDQDFEWLSERKWHSGVVKKDFIYAVRMEYNHGSFDRFYMHREILKPEKGLFVDHVDHNTLNNQRTNLRICTRSQNNQNSRKPVTRKTPSSKYKGVIWNRFTGCWRTNITIDSAVILVGNFDSEIDAAVAYNVAALKYHGEYAKLNEIDL